MRYLFRLLRSLTRIHHPYTNAFENEQARGLSLMCWTVIIVCLLYLLWLPFNNLPAQANRQFVYSVVAVVLGMGAVLFLVNRGGLFGASLTFIGLMYVVAVAVTFRYVPTPANVNFFALSVPIIAAGVLLNRRGMAAMVGLIVLTLFAIRLVNIFGLPPGISFVPPSPTEDLWLNIIFLVADGGMLATFAGGQRALLRRNVALTHDLRNSTMVSQTLARIASADEVLARALDMIRDEFGYYYVQIFLVEEKTGLLVLWGGTSIAHTRTDTARRRIPPDDPGVINEVVRQRRTLRLTTADPQALRSEFLGATRAELLAPLIREDQVLGVLDVHSIEEEAFGEHEVEILESLAAQIGAAMQNAQINTSLQDTRQERDRLAVQLREANREIDYLNREASGQGWNRYLQARGISGVGYDWRDGVLKPSGAITPGLLHALSSAMPEIQVADGKQVLSVPIVLRGQVLGAMEFQAPADQTWNNRSLELARIIAQRLALALDNIRLYEQAQIIANREQTANQVAARLQTKTDINALVMAAAETFQQALGATRTSIRLGTPDQASGMNGDNRS